MVDDEAQRGDVEFAKLLTFGDTDGGNKVQPPCVQWCMPCFYAFLICFDRLFQAQAVFEVALQ